MVHIYTFCDKTLIGRKDNKSANFLCSNLYKLNFNIDECCTFPSNFNFSNLIFKNQDIYFLLLQKSNIKLNETISNLIGCELYENDTLKKVVNDYFLRKNIPLDKNSQNEWMIPQGAIPITNPNGIGQGYLVKIEQTSIFVLPNNFSEFETIFNDCLLTYLEDNYSIEFKSETFKTFGLSEELLLNILKDQIKNKDKISVSVFSNGLDNDIVIKSKHTNEKFNYYRQTIFDKLEKYIYAVQSISMDEYLDNLIKSSNSRICIVGDFAVNNITDNLSYDTIKSNVLCVNELPSKESLKIYGINDLKYENISDIAYNLAVKALEQYANCDLVLSCVVKYEENTATTYIALGNKIKIDIYKNQFFGSTKDIMNNISQTAKFYLLKKLKARDYKTI